MSEFADSKFEEARRLIEDERFSEAIDAFSDFIAWCPDAEGAYGNRGLAYLNLGMDEQALADFEYVASLNPDDAMAYAMMAEALRYLGRYPEALSRAVQAMEIDPDDPTARLVRGWLFVNAGQYELAVEDLEIYIREIEEPGEVRDLLEVCHCLSKTPPTDLAGVLLDDEDAVKTFLADQGFCTDIAYNADYLDEGRLCPYEHCIRTRAHRGQEAPAACPLYGYDCPGGAEQTLLCQQQAPFHGMG